MSNDDRRPFPNIAAYSDLRGSVVDPAPGDPPEPDQQQDELDEVIRLRGENQWLRKMITYATKRHAQDQAEIERLREGEARYDCSGNGTHSDGSDCGGCRLCMPLLLEREFDRAEAAEAERDARLPVVDGPLPDASRVPDVPEVYAVVWRYGESVPELVRGERWRDGGTGERLVLWAWHNRPGSADVDDVIDRYVPLTWDGSPT